MKVHFRLRQNKISDAWDVAHIRARIKEYLATYPDNTEIVLNVTGGTKPMTIAAYEALAGQRHIC